MTYSTRGYTGNVRLLPPDGVLIDAGLEVTGSDNAHGQTPANMRPGARTPFPPLTSRAEAGYFNGSRSSYVNHQGQQTSIAGFLLANGGRVSDGHEPALQKRQIRVMEPRIGAPLLQPARPFVTPPALVLPPSCSDKPMMWKVTAATARQPDRTPETTAAAADNINRRASGLPRSAATSSKLAIGGRTATDVAAPQQIRNEHIERTRQILFEAANRDTAPERFDRCGRCSVQLELMKAVLRDTVTATVRRHTEMHRIFDRHLLRRIVLPLSPIHDSASERAVPAVAAAGHDAFRERTAGHLSPITERSSLSGLRAGHAAQRARQALRQESGRGEALLNRVREIKTLKDPPQAIGTTPPREDRLMELIAAAERAAAWPAATSGRNA